MLPEISDEALLHVSRAAFMDEEQAVRELLSQLSVVDGLSGAVYARAKKYVEGVRARQHFSGIEAFQQEYNLGSQEGIMMMCLAEALLRIPDKATADQLIHDKLSSGDWDAHVGLGRPWLVSAGSLGLELAGKIVDLSPRDFLSSLAQRIGEPLVRSALRHAMKLMGDVFVLGQNIEEAKKNSVSWHEKSCVMSYDMLGEGARSNAQAQHHFEQYLGAIRALPAGAPADMHLRDGISIKLSALHPRYELRQRGALQRELLPRLRTLMQEAARRSVMMTIDAEESTRLDIMLMLFTALMNEKEFSQYHGLGLAVQAYQKRAPFVIDYLRDLAASTGRTIPVRLVKGAYWDSEIKRAQEGGLPGYPVFTRKMHTDVSYLACAAKLLSSPHHFYPQFATHNARTIATIIEMAGDKEYEFQRLHGMGDALYDEVLADVPRRCRIYAPVGPSTSLLSYLIRRILENGANSSFVHGMHSAPLAELLADPITLTRQNDSLPANNIPLPKLIYSDRINSQGVDMGNSAAVQDMEYAIIDHSELLAEPKVTTTDECDEAFSRATSAFETWKASEVEARAAMLERAADLLEENRAQLVFLCQAEAKKTLADAIGEVREAADFCRYYAGQARLVLRPQRLRGPTGEQNTLQLLPRGVMVAISPWNFPLAIFIGQVAAALATGNCVIAKPAEQTPRIAARAVEILHMAGVPRDVLQLVCGSGEIIGRTIVADNRTAGVVFTGSTAAAWDINRTLAGRSTAIVPLIAETGGQNCMIIDSSALIEQTVDDMVTSAFGSAGQRCSALRVAFVQDDIADELLDVLSGAVAQLRVGDATLFATDVGPVIDAGAYKMLTSHIERMTETQRLVTAAPIPPQDKTEFLIAPHVFEISSISDLRGEVFGPILHIIRYPSYALDFVIRQINATGYGLTFGIQSRIDEKIRDICARVNIGNVYVNRSMIGATVGVQPFGGNGLSGTGPKAGGPHYLPRFCVEQVITINTSAVGGNLELLS
ncbi:MAG: L-glutamate gamma-semialdehyde dehydrogenase [Alphaproteobacteria bacterium]|nr:L-glutamate gamma-semialdehyde dehydrogenase [Alphaproteobacteria bacterium]